jgi:hypothetical protein
MAVDKIKYPVVVEVRVKDEAEGLLLLQWVATRRGEDVQYVSYAVDSEDPSPVQTVAPFDRRKIRLWQP